MKKYVYFIHIELFQKKFNSLLFYYNSINTKQNYRGENEISFKRNKRIVREFPKKFII
jgi:hypothetical protein